MTEDRNGPEDPIIRRIQQAFAHEEPATELPEVLRRAAGTWPLHLRMPASKKVLAEV
jgi:hypothetical protein